MTITQNLYYQKNEKKGIELLGMAFLFYAGSYSIKPLFNRIGIGALESIGSLLFYFLWAFALYRVLMNGRALRFKILTRILTWEAIFVLLMLCNKYCFPHTAPFYEEYMMFFRQIVIVFIPCGVVISQISDFNNAFLLLRKYAFYGTGVMIVSLMCGYLAYWDYQYWGVQLSPFIFILACNYVNNKKKIDLVLLLVDMALLLLGGRQSIIIIVLGMLFLYLFDNRKKSVKMLLIVSLGSVACLLLVSGVYVYFFQIINVLLNSVGIHMEALDRIASGNLFSTSTRDIIYEYSFLTIANNGPKVSGILSDRYYLRSIGQYNSWIQYPHNIYLEFLINFGTILGSIVSILLTWKVIRSMFLVGDNERRRIGIMICSLTMIRLFVSSSYIIEGNFFIMLGFLIGTKKRRC